MRLVDAIFRSGHLSDQALSEVCMTGERPVHLDRCDLCATRAVELGRWLDEVRAIGLEEADAAFSAERLAAQQSQILRRLEQIDRPARVIAFPGQSQLRLDGPRGIRPAWVAVAAAAGIVLGVFGGQLSNRLLTQQVDTPRPAVESPQPQPAAVAAAPTMAFDTTDPLDLDLDDRPQIDAVTALDRLTPTHITTAQVVRTNRVSR